METVADTAFLVAAFRARESSRPDGLFSDPLAERLAGERGRAMLAKLTHLGDMAGWTTVVRTVLIDRFLEEAIQKGTKTIVNLGAGLDTRPYRMTLPASLRWMEADQAPVIAHKKELLADQTPRCRLEQLEVNLVDAVSRGALLSELSKDAGPALVLAEGLLPYFTEEDVAQLLEELSRCKPVEHLIVDYIAPEVVRARNAAPANLNVSSVPLRFAPEDWQGFFAAHGWKVRTMRDLAEEGARCGRPYVVPDAMRAMMQARPGAAPAKPPGMFAAYALMERA